MSRMFPELEAVRVVVEPGVRERHIRAISDSIASLPNPPRRRFRLLAVAVAVVLTLPVLALAAENSQPGDFLYPVREVLPWSQPTDRLPVTDEVGRSEDPTISDVVPEREVDRPEDGTVDEPTTTSPARDDGRDQGDRSDAPPSNQRGEDDSDKKHGPEPPDRRPPGDRTRP